MEANSIELGKSYKYSYYRLVVKNNIENLVFSSLQLIHNSTELKKTDFTGQRSLDYIIQQGDTVTEILIQNHNRLRISKLLLDSTGNFNRNYELFDGTGQRIETRGSGELYRLDFKDAKIADTDIIPVQTVPSATLSIVIHNHDDAPIQITDVHAEYEIDKLVFAEAGDGPYQLLYGNPAAAPPQYDIINFKVQIEEGTLAVAKLGAERSFEGDIGRPADKPAWFQGKYGFNAVIIIVSVLLVIVLIRKLGRTPERKQ